MPRRKPITRGELRAYRAGRREAAALRARARQAQLRACDSGLLSDRDAALREERLYSDLAARREAELFRIEEAIAALADPDEREAVRMWIIDGRGQERIAAALHMSIPTVRRRLRAAERKITGER